MRLLSASPRADAMLGIFHVPARMPEYFLMQKFQTAKALILEPDQTLLKCKWESKSNTWAYTPVHRLLGQRSRHCPISRYSKDIQSIPIAERYAQK
jgi:hypothetical protein